MSDNPYVDPATGHTPGYPRPYVAYPYAAPMREDLNRSGRTVTVERLGKDAPAAYLPKRGQLAIVERVGGRMVRVVTTESEVTGGRDAIVETALRYAAQPPTEFGDPAGDGVSVGLSPALAEGDTRFTHGLIYDVFKVLEAHGYTRSDDNRSTASAMLALGDLVEAFEGRS